MARHIGAFEISRQEFVCSQTNEVGVYDSTADVRDSKIMTSYKQIWDHNYKYCYDIIKNYHLIFYKRLCLCENISSRHLKIKMEILLHALFLAYFFSFNQEFGFMTPPFCLCDSLLSPSHFLINRPIFKKLRMIVVLEVFEAAVVSYYLRLYKQHCWWTNLWGGKHISST